MAPQTSNRCRLAIWVSYVHLDAVRFCRLLYSIEVFSRFVLCPVWQTITAGSRHFILDQLEFCPTDGADVSVTCSTDLMMWGRSFRSAWKRSDLRWMSFSVMIVRLVRRESNSEPGATRRQLRSCVMMVMCWPGQRQSEKAKRSPLWFSLTRALMTTVVHLLYFRHR